MKRPDVAHVIRAAHLSIERLPPLMAQSGELDIYTLRRPDLADLIDGVAPEVRRAAQGWVVPSRKGDS